MNQGDLNMNKKMKYIGMPLVAFAVLAGNFTSAGVAEAANVSSSSQTVFASVNDFFNNVYAYQKGINEGLTTFNTTSSKTEAINAMKRVQANAQAIINLKVALNDQKTKNIQSNYILMMKQLNQLAKVNIDYLNGKISNTEFGATWEKAAQGVDTYFTQMQSVSEHTLASLGVTPNAKTFYVLYSQPLDSKAAFYRVKKGDTLYAIAKKNNTTVEQMKKLNNWIHNPILRVDQVMIVKIGNEHVIQKGETLYSIARQYGVSVSALKAKNELKTTSIYAGETLIIPSS
jgi:LysM repeat protein